MKKRKKITLLLFVAITVLLQFSQGQAENPTTDDELSGEYNIDSDLIEGDIKTTRQHATLFKKGGWNALVGIEAWNPRHHTKWSRTVPYVIDDDLYGHVKNAIKYSIGLFHQYTCLRFVPKQSHHIDYINFVNKRGCWSHVGRKGGRQEISLARGCYSAVPAHEIMHALGRYHEQSRPDRDSYIHIEKKNIKSGALSNFYIHSNADTQHIPYDYGSVMHYSSYAFSRNRHPTIRTKRTGFILGQRGTVSPSDILHINIRYCPEKMLRLSDGATPSQGRVEVYWNGQWGTVCDDNFDISDGHTICRYLGYPKALQTLRKGALVRGRGPIWFDEMKCTGNEYSPFSCDMNKIGRHDCTHRQDAGVVCQNNIRLVDSTTTTTRRNFKDYPYMEEEDAPVINSGRIEVYFRGQWGSICNDGSFDNNAANVVCRQLGHNGATRVYSMATSEETEGWRKKVWLSGVKCNGGESQIGYCQAEPLGEMKGRCGFKDVAVRCF